jgi:hypothetical protein
VFLFYSVDYVTGNGYKTPVWQGWFGVATTDGHIEVAGSIEPTGGYGACTAQSTSTCYVDSAMKYVPRFAARHIVALAGCLPVRDTDNPPVAALNTHISKHISF